MSIIAPIFVLALVIVVHELGHFLIAKLCRVGVLEFAIGFGRRLVAVTRGETTYAIRMIPLGGFVRMAGDDPFEVYNRDTPTPHTEQGKQSAEGGGGKSEGGVPVATGKGSVWLAERVEQTVEALDPAAEETEEERRARLIPPERWFLRKGFLAKASIVLAGPIANLLLAVILSFCLYLGFGKGEQRSDPVIGELIPNYPAAAAGVRRGDRVLAVNGVTISNWTQLSDAIHKSPTEEIVLRVERAPIDGTSATEVEEIRIVARVDNAELAMIEGRSPKESRKLVGIQPSVNRVPVGVGEAAMLATLHTYRLCEMTVRMAGALITRTISHKNIGSPIMIMQEASKSAERGIEALVDFIVLLSVSLGILNLLPIPILDGGHLVFFAIEAIRRKPVSLRIQQVANQVGLLVLAALMILAVKNDIFRLAGVG